MSRITVEFSESQLQGLRRRLKDDRSRTGQELYLIVAAALGGEPTETTCPHDRCCPRLFTSIPQIERHLIKVHNYPGLDAELAAADAWSER